MKQAISSPQTPAAVGPYSAGIEKNGTVYLSGQLPIDKSTGTMPESIEEQTLQSLANVKGLLESCGLSLSDVVKTTVYLTDIGDFKAMNRMYEQCFASPFPARSAFAVAALPMGAKVEIECIAVR